MPFSLTHKVCSYLMVMAAIGSVVLSSGLSAVATVIVVAGVTLSWFAEAPRYRVENYTTIWNVAALAFLAYLVLRVAQGGEVIVAGLSFLLFVLINKLFNRRSSRDYQQAYVISFLMLIAATTLNTGLSYAVCFVGYVVFATWSLALLHLRREMEENYLLKHTEAGHRSEKVEVERILNSRRIVGPGFLAGTSALSVGMLLVATLIFTFFPRIGFGLFSGPKRRGLTMAGFSDRVRLGHHGTIRDNQRVVMRVVFGSRTRPIQPPLTLRWRGSVFDRYEEGVWRHSDDLAGRTMVVAPSANVFLLNSAPGLPPVPTVDAVRQQTLRQEIYLEPLDAAVIFGVDRPVAIELPEAKIGQRRPFVPRRGPFGEIRASNRRTVGAHYIAYSKLVTPSSQQLRAGHIPQDESLARFLQLPADLPQRVRKLAERITAGRYTIYDRVLAVQSYLRRNYTYTLALTHEKGHEPLDEFLFETRRGHCEYFATAMAVLLRAAGIHSRHVNGFVNGQWNHYGQYLAVRQADAHAWTEVLFSNLGWVAFDATPSGSLPRPEAGGLLSGMGQLLDALRMRWFTYVVEYDLSKQIAMVERVRHALAGRGSAQDAAGFGAWLRGNRRTAFLSGALVLLFAAGLVLRGWLRRRLRGVGERGRGAVGAGRHPATLVYLRMLRLLEAAALTKSVDLTPAEFARRLSAAGHASAPIIGAITERYYAARFGGAEGAGHSDSHDLGLMLAELKESLRASGTRPMG